MRRAWMVAVAALMCVPLSAAERGVEAQQAEGQKQAYLVIDRTIEELQGQVYGSPFGVAMSMGVNSATGGGADVMPGLNYGQAVGVGMAGGIIAGMIIDGAAHAARNGQIEVVREVVDDGVLRNAMLASVSKHFEAAGHPIAKRVIARSVEPRIIKRAIGDERPDEVILFDSQDMALVLLSLDNRRVLVQGDIGLYAHESGRRYEVVREHRVAFVSPPSPEGVDPLQYWADDNGRRVLDAVDLAIGHIVAAVTSPQTLELPEIDAETRVELMLDGNRVRTSGMFLAQHGDYAYLAAPFDWLRIWPATLAGPLVPEPAEAPTIGADVTVPSGISGAATPAAAE